MPLTLYTHPVSTASRPVNLFIAEKGLKVEPKIVDLMKGEHYQDWYISINPSHMVPMLEDGDFRLTESSAILKYLASRFDLPEYPKDLEKRAKVDEMMDWFNTQFYRDFAYSMAYPQMFPNHKRPSAEAQESTINWGKERAEAWLKILDARLIGPDKPYLCGNEITIADYFGASIITLGEVIRCDFSHLPNICRWLSNVKKLNNWDKVNAGLYGFANAVKGHTFKAITP